MSHLRLLYTMNDPHPKADEPVVKVGSSGLDVFLTRLGNYQQGNGPNYEVTWPMCWIGVESVTNLLEDALKWELKQERGVSRLGEWYDGFTSETVIPIIEDLIDGNGFKIKKVDSIFLPISYSNMAETRKKMLEHYQKKSILSDFLVG